MTHTVINKVASQLTWSNHLKFLFSNFNKVAPGHCKITSDFSAFISRHDFGLVALIALKVFREKL